MTEDNLRARRALYDRVAALRSLRDMAASRADADHWASRIADCERAIALLDSHANR